MIISNLLKCELLMEKKSQNKGTHDKEMMAKSIKVFVIGAPDHWVDPHTPDNSQRAGYEYQLHHCVIDGDKVRKQIQISCQKHHSV